MNCKKCNTPAPAHELHRELCLRCLGKEYDELNCWYAALKARVTDLEKELYPEENI